MGSNKFTCPRRVEQGMDDENSPFRGSGKNDDYWNKREGHNVCSYCGSIRPEALFEAIDNGTPVGTTDKSYKLYVDLPGDGKKRSRGSANFPQTGYKKVPFKKEWKAPAEPTLTFHAKFYFQHFSKDEMIRFVDLFNEKKINYAGGFGFYVMPFFMTSSKEEK
jgi:hypothetical protein